MQKKQRDEAETLSIINADEPIPNGSSLLLNENLIDDSPSMNGCSPHFPSNTGKVMNEHDDSKRSQTDISSKNIGQRKSVGPLQSRNGKKSLTNQKKNRGAPGKQQKNNLIAKSVTSPNAQQLIIDDDLGGS